MNSSGRNFLIAGLVVILAGASLLLLRQQSLQESARVGAEEIVAGTAAAATAASNATPQAPEKILTFAADDWCPVSCDGSNGAPEGYAIDIARAIFGKAGYRVEYSLQPWARAVSETRKGSVAAIVGILKDNAADFVYPQESIGSNRNVFFTRSDSTWRYRGVASLDKVVVAVANEYAFGEPFDSYVKTHHDDERRLQVLFSDAPVTQGIGLLESGRVDAYVDDRMVVNWSLQRRQVPLQLREAGDVSVIPLYIAFSPAHPDAEKLAEEFDAGVQQLRRSGELAALLAKYGLEPW